MCLSLSFYINMFFDGFPFSWWGSGTQLNLTNITGNVDMCELQILILEDNEIAWMIRKMTESDASCSDAMSK